MGYQGLLVLEIDYLHPDYGTEENAIRQSMEHLRTLVAILPNAPHTD